ncbi:polysaccharide deacetylase family protein [Alloalcanivorax gelatiniphagus]|uniref:polysaccharide deacetylase family protein n=1 Tax=Alloalcanivorax gelatiniphagus TaxID=1194167 RepID=UPI001F0EE4CF|nr:polysaccharide deacetylase family protein [Alloalcanivorax gelatiniphagus]
MSLSGLVSIHDVMPETREPVAALLDHLAAVPPDQVTLLVVPGKDWSDQDLDWLRDLAARGYPLAGHGWRHRCDPPRSLHHRLHSAFISRDVAEHLSLDGAGIAMLIRDCHRWFVEHGLTPSPLYVPPAWALGAIDRHALAALPFRYFETLGGVYDARERRFHRLPLVGFEADNLWRAASLALFNQWNLGMARALGRPVRVSIHPRDLSLKLGGQVLPQVRRLDRTQGYPDLAPVAP